MNEKIKCDDKVSVYLCAYFREFAMGVRQTYADILHFALEQIRSKRN